MTLLIRRVGGRAVRSLYGLSVTRRLRPRAAVLVYHRVSETTDDPYRQAVLPETFARHLEMLAEKHPIMPLGTLVDAMPSRDYPDGTVAITFDDGYADNLLQAVPLAEEIPLTVFVTVEPVLDGDTYWWDDIAGLEPRRREELHDELKGLPSVERKGRLATLAPFDGVDRGRPMTPAELHELAARPGVEIGAHTLSHPCLARLTPAEQQRELTEARTRLETFLGQKVTLAAYPFGKRGDVSGVTEAAARDAGYRAAFTTMQWRLVPSSPRYALPRITVHEWSTEALRHRLESLFSA
jgi:peptidoglycan/xylan/chitin deacetylase (PgdA/CDA1 family)